ncbi:MAG: phage tail tube protein [Clostridium sp.]|nr:phage tail tube protein [Clostridium sp.]
MDTNRVALRIVEEEENGVIPENPQFTELRNTGSPGFGYNPTTITSNEIRPDRQVADITTVGAEPGGEVDGELSYGAYDMVFEGAFQKRWIKTASVAGSNILAVNDENNLITISGDIPEGLVEGSLILLSGFKNNSGVKTVSSIEGGITTVESLEAETVIPADAEIKVVGFQGQAGAIKATTPNTESKYNHLISDTIQFDTLGLSEGMWIKLGDADSAENSFDTKANNEFVRVENIENNIVNLGFVPKGWAPDVADDKKIRIYFGDFLKNADKEMDPTKPIEIISYTLEQSFLDHSPIDYQYVSYMIPDTMSISMNAADFITINTSFQGGTAAVSTTRVSGATDKASAQNPVMNTSSNIARIARGETQIKGANYVSELSMEINNNARRRNAVGVFGAWSIGVGEFAVTGTMNTYFSNADLLQDLVNNQETSLNFVVKDNSKHAYFFDLPRVKYSSGNPEVSGKNEDVMLSLDYQAIRDPNLGYTLSLSKFDYVN